MNLDKIRDFFHHLSTHDLPTGVAALAGLFCCSSCSRLGSPS
jgi:hypothetical protein